MKEVCWILDAAFQTRFLLPNVHFLYFHSKMWHKLVPPFRFNIFCSFSVFSPHLFISGSASAPYFLLSLTEILVFNVFLRLPWWYQKRIIPFCLSAASLLLFSTTPVFCHSFNCYSSSCLWWIHFFLFFFFFFPKERKSTLNCRIANNCTTLIAILHSAFRNNQIRLCVWS